MEEKNKTNNANNASGGNNSRQYQSHNHRQGGHNKKPYNAGGENSDKQNKTQNNKGNYHHHPRHNYNKYKKQRNQNEIPNDLKKDVNVEQENIIDVLPAIETEVIDFDAGVVENVQIETEDISVPEPQSTEQETVDEESTPIEVIGVRFKSSEKTYYFDPAGYKYTKGSYVIVETARGLEYGEVSLSNTFVTEKDIVSPLRPVVRAATDADKKHNLENKEKENQAFVICNEQIILHKLDMKLIDAQYTFDNSKLLFYFTSSGRVDFRELVKDLASIFKTRIELRQIGIRDEAKLIGGLGLCGRPLCCALFLTDFGQVSIKMAKEQNLSLNSTKISGACGRLMCCLRFEHETYEYEIKRTPPVDSTVKTKDGVGTVTEISPLSGMIKVKLDEKSDSAPKSYHRDEVTVIKK